MFLLQSKLLCVPFNTAAPLQAKAPSVSHSSSKVNAICVQLEFLLLIFCLSGSHTSAKCRGSSSTYTASIQLRSFPSYTPPAINFSRTVDQTSIFNWSQGAPYMLNGKKHFLLPQKFQCIFSSCFLRLSALLARRSEGFALVLFGLHLQF